MEVLTVEEQLAKFRTGYKETVLKWGDWCCPIQILNAEEENKIILNVRSGKTKNYPNDEIKKQEENLEIMKLVLLQSAYVDGKHNLTRKFLDNLSGSEIESLYDQYIDLCHQINPEFESFSSEKIGEIIKMVKKNPAKARDLSTSQLKGIGLYFLEEILPMVSELGSN